MKLASVNTSMDFSVDDALMSNKDVSFLYKNLSLHRNTLLRFSLWELSPSLYFLFLMSLSKAGAFLLPEKRDNVMAINYVMRSAHDSFFFNFIGRLSIQTFQSINSMPNPQMYALDSSAFHGQNISDGTVSHCPVDPLGMGTSRSLDAHLAPLNDLQVLFPFTPCRKYFPRDFICIPAISTSPCASLVKVNHPIFLSFFQHAQYQSFCGGDLQTIVQMGFAQSSQQDSAYPLQPLHGKEMSD